MAQLVRAPPCHGGGREFESLLGRLYGIIAQLGEHLPYKQRVIGSSPIGPIKLKKEYGWIPEWPKGTDCKSAAICFGGSNPPLPILLFEELNIIAGWSSLEARRAHNPKVVGSNPAPATRTGKCAFAQIAQSVEQRTENPRVTGSIPVLGTMGY